MHVVELREHEFVRAALLDAVQVQHSLVDRAPMKLDPVYRRDPDEHEFYVLRVGHAVAELITSCEQIAQTVAYLSSFVRRPKLTAAGVTRHSHLLYHIENHLIRTHSLYDRSLLLVDAVFHLMNDRRESTHGVVIGNLRVTRTSVPAKLKSLRKLLGKTIDARNEVIHHESFKDDSLRELEMYCVYQSLPSDSDSPRVAPQWVAREINQLSRSVIGKKRREFEQLNAALFSALADLMSVLQPHYAREKKFLELRVAKE